MALGVVDLLEIRFVPDRRDPLLERHHLVVACHDHDSAELEPLGEVHGPDGDAPLWHVHLLVEEPGLKPRLLDGARRAGKLPLAPDQHADHLGRHTLFDPRRQPLRNRVDLRVLVLADLDLGRRAVKDGDSIGPDFAIAVRVGDLGPEESVGDSPDLVGGAVVHAQGARTALYLHPERLPREGRLEDPLAQVSREEEPVRPTPAESGKEPELGHGEVLCLVHDREVVGRMRARPECLRQRREDLDVAAMIRQEPTYVLLDAQYVVFNSIVARAKAALAGGERTAFVVRGGPGTGKSVLAVNLVAELSKEGLNTHHATGSRAFTETVRKIVGPRASSQFKYFNSYLNAEENEIDVLVCDEAHRIREHSWDRWTRQKSRDPERLQIDELLSVAKVSVFFLDDMQSVRRNEIGRSIDIENAAREFEAKLHTYDLEIQFRCGGSDGFVRWIENTFGIRRTANPLWTGDERFEFRIVDSPEELDRLVRGKAAAGDSARLVAGYCWEWSDPRPDGTLEEDVRIGPWSRPWNAKPDAGRLARGIPKSHLWASEPCGLDQVGCIYTAQGFEFDYVGVIFGTDLVYRRGIGWIGQKDASQDGGLKRGTESNAFTALVKNAYRVLLTRGLKGCFVFFRDEETRHFVEGRIESYPREEGFGSAVAADPRP